jgi:hypothetical protein
LVLELEALGKGGPPPAGGVGDAVAVVDGRHVPDSTVKLLVYSKHGGHETKKSSCAGRTQPGRLKMVTL